MLGFVYFSTDDTGLLKVHDMVFHFAMIVIYDSWLVLFKLWLFIYCSCLPYFSFLVFFFPCNNILPASTMYVLLHNWHELQYGVHPFFWVYFVTRWARTWRNIEKFEWYVNGVFFSHFPRVWLFDHFCVLMFVRFFSFPLFCCFLFFNLCCTISGLADLDFFLVCVLCVFSPCCHLDSWLLFCVHVIFWRLIVCALWVVKMSRRRIGWYVGIFCLLLWSNFENLSKI